jgi:short-subunit dehydrogenase
MPIPAKGEHCMPAETVLITGASSGIGRELARVFAAAGSDLVLVARREARLAELAQELTSRYRMKAHVLPKDLSLPDAGRAIDDELRKANIRVDVLVNDAGFGDLGLFASLGLDRQMKMVQVNVNTVTELTRRFLPGMIERGRGGILNVASTSSFQPGPLMSVYYATKAYVLYFSEGLAEELSGTGVSVTCLCPGPTITEFGADSHMDGTLAFRMGAMSAAVVAQAGYEGFRRGKAIVVPGFRNKLMAFSVRTGPRSVVRKIVKLMHQ